MEPTHLQRLAFIKYLFSVGVNQSYQLEPIYGLSILFFHDSVEMFLQLSLEKLNLAKGDRGLMKYFEIIDTKLKNKNLSQKESMRRLNEARNGLKHDGIIPSRLDIESFRATTQAFFTENCPIIFQSEFGEISLINSITFERPKKCLKQARTDFDKGLIYESIQNLILSFTYLITDYEESKKSKFERSPFFFGDTVRSFDRFHSAFSAEHKKLRDFADKVSESIGAIQTAIKILSFGIDYKKYVRFNSIVSCVDVLISDSGYVHPYKKREVKLSKEELDFCINFIVESALKLQEFDFELEKQ